MEKMYLTNNKLIVQEAKQAVTKPPFLPSFSFSVTLLSIMGIGLLAYTMFERSRSIGEV